MIKKKSGVDKALYEIYDFSDHLWSQAVNDPFIDDLVALSENVAMLDGNYCVYVPSTGNWSIKSKDSAAQKEIANIYTNTMLSTGRIVTAEHVNSFITGRRKRKVARDDGSSEWQDQTIGSCPQMDAVICIPHGPKFVKFQGQRCLNTWRNEAIAPDPELHSASLGVLRLIYRSLCAGAELDPDPRRESEMLLEQSLTGQWTNRDFGFVIQWLAAIVQFPGVNLLTNIWFVGQLQGVGKGTLIKIMKYVLGVSAVTKLNQQEIAGGWNDHLNSAQLIEGDEFDGDIKVNWNNWVKANTCEPLRSVRQRNTTTYTVINTGNYIFASNEEDPLDIDPSDRRNHFIKTTDDRHWIGYASTLYQQLISKDAGKIAAGFAAVLESVPVDRQTINYAFINEHKKRILESRQDIVTTWLVNDPVIESRLNGETWYLAEVLYKEFKDWFREWHPSDRLPTMTGWGKLMKNNRKRVDEKRSSKGQMYLLFKNPAPEKAIDWELCNDEMRSIMGSDFEERQAIDDLEVANPTRREVSQMEILRAKLKNLSENQ